MCCCATDRTWKTSTHNSSSWDRRETPVCSQWSSSSEQRNWTKPTVKCELRCASLCEGTAPAASCSETRAPRWDPLQHRRLTRHLNSPCSYFTCCVCPSPLPQPVMSDHGLLTTVAYKLGKEEPACYALEVCVVTVQLHITSPWCVRARVCDVSSLLPPGLGGHSRGSGPVAEGQHGHRAVLLRDRYLPSTSSSAPHHMWN